MYIWKAPLNALPGASTTLPFLKYMLVVPATIGAAWLYVPFVTFVMTATSNAVNLTDGLDGLAAGLMAIAMATFAIFAYAMGRIDASAYLQLFYLRDAGELTSFASRYSVRASDFSGTMRIPRRSSWAIPERSRSAARSGRCRFCSSRSSCSCSIGGVFVAETTSVLDAAHRVQIPSETIRPRVRAAASRLPASAAASPFRNDRVARDAGRGALLDSRRSLRVRRTQHAQASVIREQILRGEVAVIGLGGAGRPFRHCCAAPVRAYMRPTQPSRMRGRSPSLPRLAWMPKGGGHDLDRIGVGSGGRREPGRASRCARRSCALARSKS